MTRFLILRIGAMGDILHALPAVESLHRRFPDSEILWVAARRWWPLLDDNPAISGLIDFDRSSLGALHKTWKHLRSLSIDTAFDLQGLIKSALAGRAARPHALIGARRAQLREPLAALLYSRQIDAPGPHRVQRSLQIVGAPADLVHIPQPLIPNGTAEGTLPTQPFVLGIPFSGWRGKEWPLDAWQRFGQMLAGERLSLVLNVPASRAAEVSSLRFVTIHTSTLRGLIHATRRAQAVIAPDSGPLHLAAALRKPGVALFGPTDPEQNGPFGGSLSLVHASGFETTYRRDQQTHPSMRAITPESVWAALEQSLACQVK